VGGVTALALAMIVGPRIGKYNRNGSPNAMPGHDIVIVLTGCFILASDGSGSIRQYARGLGQWSASHWLHRGETRCWPVVPGLSALSSICGIKYASLTLPCRAWSTGRFGGDHCSQRFRQ